MANTTWSTTDKSAGVVLSNLNLTATVPSAAGAVRAVDEQNTGKFYWEFTLNTNGSTWDFGAGIAASGVVLGYGSGGGVAGVSFTVDRANGFIWNGASSVGSVGGGIATGGVLCCAMDFTNRLGWFRNGAAGNWNNNVANNPATGVGGIAIPGVPAFGLYPFAGFSGVASGQNVVANFGDTAFVGAVPAGFTSGFTAGATIVTSEVATQVAVEQWAVGAPNMQLTQTVLEQWATVTTITPQVVATQIALEHWASATLGAAAVLLPGLISSAEVVYPPSLQITLILTPGFIPGSEVVYPPTLGVTQTITLGFIAGSEIVFPPHLEQELLVDFIASSEIVYQPRLVPEGILRPDFIRNENEFFLPGIIRLTQPGFPPGNYGALFNVSPGRFRC